MIDPSRFRIKPGGESLTKADFEEFPAWSEYYDFEELELIASWGVNKENAAAIFMRDSGGAHPHYTILDLERLPLGNMRIFLKADFQSPSGKKIDGYIMNADAFVIGLFSGKREVTFSWHPSLRGRMLSAKKELEGELGLSELFPLAYRTNFQDADGNKIVGEFSLIE